MCGIVGIIDLELGISDSLVKGMLDCLAHRGPDNAGSYIDPKGSVGLGHRRLSILDLSARGRQPMSTPDGRLTVVYNGEIYNYVELREELEKKGVSFTTSTDTEVLLRAYEIWGKEAAQKFVGMFAFAIWDRDEQTLFLARDRVGKKPLLYFWDGRTFAFASELKALMLAPRCESRLDREAVEIYLALGYVPAPFCIFQNVKKLQPGHCLRFTEKRIHISRYWYPEKASRDIAVNLDGRVEQFRTLFEDAVHLRLRADVPIAVFLSGGVDSSAVAAECIRQGQKLHAFTVAFDQDQTDLPFARKVARHLDIDQEVIYASAAQIQEDLPRIVWHYDEPFADSSNISSYYVARATNGRFKVVLNGDGGDEAFAGYRHYEHIGLKQCLKGWAATIGLRDGMPSRPWTIYFQSKAIFRKYERNGLLGKRAVKNDVFAEFLNSDPFLQACGPVDALHRAQWGDRHIYLPNDLLFKMDIALMAHGIEGRSPFLDHRLLEWAQGLPSCDLVQGFSKKVLLREAYKRVLPTEILSRPKHGFGAPIARWLEGSLQRVLEECLPTPLLETKSQQNLINNFLRKRGSSECGRVWALFMFGLWAQEWKATW